MQWKVNASALAHLSAAPFICEVWIPDALVHEQRALVAHRATLQKQCARVKNRVPYLLQRHNLHALQSLSATDAQAWLQAFPLSTLERLQAHHLAVQLELLQQQLDETDRLIA